jgi:hypothetical protein
MDRFFTPIHRRPVHSPRYTLDAGNG